MSGKQLAFDLTITLCDLDSAINKSIVKNKTNELYRHKNHSQKCRQVFNRENFYGCAMYEFNNNMIFSKSRQCNWERGNRSPSPLPDLN